MQFDFELFFAPGRTNINGQIFVSITQKSRKKHVASLGFHSTFSPVSSSHFKFELCADFFFSFVLCVLKFLIFSFHFVSSLVVERKNYGKKKKQATRRENKTKSQYGRQRLSWKLWEHKLKTLFSSLLKCVCSSAFLLFRNRTENVARKVSESDNKKLFSLPENFWGNIIHHSLENFFFLTNFMQKSLSLFTVAQKFLNFYREIYASSKNLTSSETEKKFSS